METKSSEFVLIVTALLNMILPSKDALVRAVYLRASGLNYSYVDPTHYVQGL